MDSWQEQFFQKIVLIAGGVVELSANTGLGVEEGYKAKEDLFYNKHKSLDKV